MATPTLPATQAAGAAAAPGEPSAATPSPAATAQAGGAPLWPWGAGIALVAAIGAGLWMRRGRPASERTGAEPVAAALPVPPPPVAVRPRLDLSFRPTRAGLNMLTATVEGEATLVNAGTVAVRDVRLRAALFTAHPGLDADIAAERAAPVARLAGPAFALAPGETRTLRVVAAVQRDAIQVMKAVERPMFVPVVALDASFDAADAGSGAVGQAFAVGVERVDSPKLAPFWLDAPARSYGQVAARAHGAAVERRS